MAQKTTKDELFLLKLYQMAEKAGDLFSEIDRYVIGKVIGQNDKGIDNIVRHLAQANFIKKGDGASVHLTPHGLWLIEEQLLPR